MWVWACAWVGVVVVGRDVCRRVWDSSLNDRTFVVCYIHYENTLYSKFNFLILVIYCTVCL